MGQLLEHYRGYILSLANDELDVDLVARVAPSDLVQETCLQAARDFPNFEGSTEAELRTWLRRILLNNLGDLRRRFLGTQKRGSAQERAMCFALVCFAVLGLDPLLFFFFAIASLDCSVTERIGRRPAALALMARAVRSDRARASRPLAKYGRA